MSQPTTSAQPPKPPKPPPLIDVTARQKLASYLQGPVADDVADLAIASATGTVRAYCGWHIAPSQAETFRLDGTGGTILTLPTLRLVEVTELRLSGRAYEDYVPYSRGQLYRAGGWPTNHGEIEVDAVHGYDEVPDAVMAVLLSMAARSIWTPGRSAELRSLSVGGIQQTFEPRSTDDITPLQKAQLAGVKL